jgi:hypothetical protein
LLKSQHPPYVPPWARGIRSYPTMRPDYRSPMSSRPCRFGPACTHLAEGRCFNQHLVTPTPRSELMLEDLSGPVALPAFRDVDTTDKFGIEDARSLASYNLLADGRVAIPGESELIELVLRLSSLYQAIGTVLSKPPSFKGPRLSYQFFSHLSSSNLPNIRSAGETPATY